LSCAKTAVKIAQQQHPGQDGWWSLPAAYLSLHSTETTTTTTTTTTSHPQLEEGLALLRTMDVELQQLESLVRRRGHTNDPTELIAVSVKRLETDAQELSSLITKMMPSQARGQSQKHWHMVQQWFQSTAQHQGSRLKDILKIRATVLAEQELRRQRFSTVSAGVKHTYHPSPLFLDSPVRPSTTTPQPNGSIPRQTLAPNGTRSTSYYGGAPSYYGGPRPYGGGYGSSNSHTPSYQGHSVGMRQRRGMSHDTQQNDTQHAEQMLQQRLQQRQTNQRLQEARQAERSLVELGTLFGKMSSLITQQSEVLEKVEDDVEAAFTDVTAGQQEIAVLQALKKGNRALIIKVFALLIFFIIFMRVYKGK
jgi:syntaxin 5